MNNKLKEENQDLINEIKSLHKRVEELQAKSRADFEKLKEQLLSELSECKNQDDLLAFLKRTELTLVMNNTIYHIAIILNENLEKNLKENKNNEKRK